MTFREQLILTLIDKLLIAAVIVLIGWGLNRILEKLRSELALKNELVKLRDAKRLDFLDKQLSQFYYPLYIRLHIDGAVSRRILDNRNGDDDLRSRVGAAIERNIILPNHDEIVKTIQANIHLAESDGLAFDQMLRYVRHVSVYKQCENQDVKIRILLHSVSHGPQSCCPLSKPQLASCRHSTTSWQQKIWGHFTSAQITNQLATREWSCSLI